jgi:carbon monoxide dehydrogenase subunit G
MHLSGTVSIAAPRERVYEFLTDPHQVSQCAPGVESIEILVPGQKFKAKAGIGFGSVKATFTGEAEWVELDPPNRAKVKGRGNAPGSAAEVVSEMTLTEAGPGQTQMTWTADVAVLGQLASLAARMMAPVSQKLTAQFFECAKKKIEGAVASAAGAAEAAGAAGAAPAASAASAGDGGAGNAGAAAPDSAAGGAGA